MKPEDFKYFDEEELEELLSAYTTIAKIIRHKCEVYCTDKYKYDAYTSAMEAQLLIFEELRSKR